MRVKTFHALSMQEAIRAIKAELGPDAVILSSKEVRHGGRLLSCFNKPVLEVMAAAEDDPLPVIKAAPEPEPAPPAPAPAPRTQAKEPSKKTLRPAQPAAAAPQVEPAPVPKEAFHATLQSLLTEPSRPSQRPAADPAPLPAAPIVAPTAGPVKEAAAPAPAPPASTSPKDTKGANWKRARAHVLRQELRAMSQKLAAGLPVDMQTVGAQANPEMTMFCRNLVAQGLRPSSADRIGHELTARGLHPGVDSLEAQEAALADVLAKDLRMSGPLTGHPGDRAIAILVGTSGAGKTSSVAKLAAHYRLEEKRSVAIVTLDTYRPAAVEQLRMYSKVLGVPFASAMSVKQVAEGLRRQTRAEVILIDTPGFHETDLAMVHDLHRALADEAEVQTHLVAPASMREQDLHRHLARVQSLPLLRLLFTKLDETDGFGGLYDLAYHGGIPLSYWSAGQRVPEDVELATPRRLAEFLIRRRYRPPQPAPEQEPVAKAAASSETTNVVIG